MKTYVTKNVLGIFAVSGKGELLAYVPFSSDPKETAASLTQDSPEELTLLKKRLPDYELEIEWSKDISNFGGEYLRSNLTEILSSTGISREEYLKKLRGVSFSLARGRFMGAMGEDDKKIIQAIESIDDLDETTNLLTERLREWVGHNFPELAKEVPDPGKYAELISSYGSRENFQEFQELARDSIGGFFDVDDTLALKQFAARLKGLYDLKGELEQYLNDLMERTAPNIKYLLGAGLGARLLSLSGGLGNLAVMPASRIQILGAEKALFRHLKQKQKPPKHGILFQLPVIKSSPWWQRGKLARSLASKVAIAARVDYGSKELVAERLKLSFEKRVEMIKRDFSQEPKKMRIIPYVPEPVKKKKGKHKKKRGKKR